MLKYIDNVTKKMALNRYNSILKQIKKLEGKYNDLSNDELKNKLLSLKSDKFKNYPEALVLIKQLSKRFFLLDPYEVQIKGALVLNDGMIAEMKTGEGKTLVTVISLILNYLSNKNAHIVTANDYLVKRDYDFSKPLFDFLGITSAFIEEGQNIQEKQSVYNSDIVYSTSKGLVFDYLNNNRFKSKEMIFNERRDFIIVDEVDFVLIDEARTPIILSGVLETDKEMYKLFQEIQEGFKGSHKNKELEVDDPDFFYTTEVLELTEKGFNKLENKLIEKGIIDNKRFLYDGSGFKYIKYIERALRANYIFKKDIHYLVQDDKVVIINGQTGRPQHGRRFSDGLHQALEVKENVTINSDAQSLAQTTLQNYFRKYKKIAGTTGTALTEEMEFKEFYFMKVLPIETNKPLIRKDTNDILFMTKKAMKKNLVLDIKENLKDGRPTLIGVQSVTDSEDIAKLLSSQGISFEVLDAKNHEREAYIIEQAGKSGSVTIATNMAGRGTDIMLGGNRDSEISKFLEDNPSSNKDDALAFWKQEHDKVVDAGGLSVMGVGRSESRRLDNQLIGRAGRQGDPGMTKYYLTLEDPLFSNIDTTFLKNHWKKENEDAPLSANLISKIVREAQKSTEGHGFNMRKNLLKFDNINTEQREIFYDWRRKVVYSEDLSNVVKVYFKDVISNIIEVNSIMEEFLANDLASMEKDFKKYLGLDISIRDVYEKEDLNDAEDLIDFIYGVIIKNYEEKSKILEKSDMHLIEKDALLRIMDQDWAENISSLEEMRISTGLRAYAQKNPLDEYQKEALEMFKNLVMNVKKDFCLLLMKFSPYAVIENREQEKRQYEEHMKKSEDNLKKEETSIDGSKLNFLPRPIEGVGI